jgi:mRNA-degrading endonuclease toxin of MazEF toxin-antitoxin module
MRELSKASPPVVVAVPSAGPDSVAADQVRAVDKRRFVSAKGLLSTSDLEALEEAIGRVLDLPR